MPTSGHDTIVPDLARIVAYARQLRVRMTDAEELLWKLVRNRRLLGFKFRRQHPIGRYILDFYCEEAMLAIELDGGQHAEIHQAAYDAKRTKFLKAQGIIVMQFWDNEMLLMTEDIIEEIARILIERCPEHTLSMDGDWWEDCRRMLGRNSTWG